MEEEDRNRKEGLKRLILSQIEGRGPLPFVHFMEWCLYHPDFGYYQTEGEKIGKEGDYYTSHLPAMLDHRASEDSVLSTAVEVQNRR